MAIYLDNAAEIYTQEGPTGEFAEVTHGRVEDAGGNLLFSGTANQCVRQLRNRYGGERVLVPTAWKRVVGPVVGARNHQWQFVVE